MQLKHSHLHEYTLCGRQVSPMTGTVFEHTRLPLPKWLAAIYLMGADKGRISAQRIFKMIGVSWSTAYRITRILRQCMWDRDRDYWFEGLVEVNDAFVGGRKLGKRGRGTEGKKSVIFAVEQRDNGMGFMAACLVERVNSEQVRKIAMRISPHSDVPTGAFKALRIQGDSYRHESKATSLKKANKRLPKVLLSSAISRDFWREPSPRYHIDTFRSILPNLCFVSIADSGNLSCQLYCRKPSLVMYRFRLPSIQFRFISRYSEFSDILQRCCIS